MSKDHGSRQALARILHQKSGNQVLSLGWDLAPFGVGELVAAVLDGVEEQLLATVARLTLESIKGGDEACDKQNISTVLIPTSGQSYKAPTIIIYDSRVVPDLKLPHITTLES